MYHIVLREGIVLEVDEGEAGKMGQLFIHHTPVAQLKHEEYA